MFSTLHPVIPLTPRIPSSYSPPTLQPLHTSTFPNFRPSKLQPPLPLPFHPQPLPSRPLPQNFKLNKRSHGHKNHGPTRNLPPPPPLPPPLSRPSVSVRSTGACVFAVIPSTNYTQRPAQLGRDPVCQFAACSKKSYHPTCGAQVSACGSWRLDCAK